MILRLRQRHRRIFIALGVFLPIALAVALAARKAVPTVTVFSASLAATPQSFGAVKWERADLFAKSPVQVRLLREQMDVGRFAIALSAAHGFVKPDLIVYWVEGDPKITDALPTNAILLGTFGATTLPLSHDVAKSSGALILYSLADNEIVDMSKPIGFSDSTK